MKVIESTLQIPPITYPIEQIAPLNNILFIDIETTGFVAKSSNLYLIGALFYYSDHWTLKQWLADNLEEEKDILSAFIEFCSGFHTLIHFNGNNFDLPYLSAKCLTHGIDVPFSSMEGIDLYRRIAPYKSFLHLENCKQKTIEDFLDITRDDTLTGKDLITIYQNYSKQVETDFLENRTNNANKSGASDENLNLLLLHNADDIKGMFQLLPILSYTDIFLKPFRVVKVQSSHFKDLEGYEYDEIIMKIRFHTAFPKPLSVNHKKCYFSAEGKEGFLKVPLLNDELKYFYSNYKDYYYLPSEDMALHKSVSEFVDKEHRLPATARTCYTKKESTYLPQWDILFEPIFKKEYEEKHCYFELTDDMKKNPEVFRKYALHILDMVAHDNSL